MKDKIFRFLLFLAAVLILLLTAGIVYALVSRSTEAFGEYGIWSFIVNPEWDPRPATEEYGAMSFILGTLYTAFFALFLCIPFSFSVALFNGEYFKGMKISSAVRSVVDLLAGIPSIVYGLWGFYTIRPLIIDMGINAQGFGIFLSSVVLAIMIIPYASSLSTEFLSMVPNNLKEGAYSLGATRIEVIRHISIPSSLPGIVASYILALGRALGETMAVTMLIGNTDRIPQGLRDTGNTMASVIANQFGEADGFKLSSLIAIGLLLFVITAIINMIAKLIMKRVSRL
ncbi:MAG: phosphate ABC transporter permease subunit PstC [Bacteroidales bacterium]|jgi:phosphate transport system permease protein|nr:phosphate ABC transporter permease subunit PstC [Bacteroidales bacterium]MDD2831124.1 phosphate ABC transporter permease subunit PstC [Bacteroidales bacterium]MDD3697638.1 phosphate ABC transporter permease subunit PstC [Bacteroidales bacterium]MDD4168575.1 phosphate ABC transporter permease subunit PstC [Bacteroidales bacterium]MDD4473985.1 phosphate ABC transporter permease subunit PstC [Bacteroidales bacterium]